MGRSAGNLLRDIRLKLGYTLQDVAAASEQIAAERMNDAFALSMGRLSEIESKGSVPSIFRISTLATIYRMEPTDLCRLYGVELKLDLAASLKSAHPRNTHLVQCDYDPDSPAVVPLKLDPAYRPEETQHLSRVIERWGALPLSLLSGFANDSYTYGYIGTQDYTMYPLIPPGSFVRIDTSLTKPDRTSYFSEYERPIYFIETKGGYKCSWCTLSAKHLQITPHPRSSVAPEVFDYPREAEILGQIVAVALGLPSPNFSAALCQNTAQREHS